jgi:hypothetical protein
LTRENDFTPAATLVRHVVASLESIDRLEQIWKRGIVHVGGAHYRLRGTTGPISIGEGVPHPRTTDRALQGAATALRVAYHLTSTR